MGNKLIDDLVEIKDSQVPALVHYMSNGEVNVVDMSYLELLNKFDNKKSIADITKIIKRAAEMYKLDGKFDRITANLDMGLVYYKDDVDNKNRIIGCSKPINNIVFYTATDISSYYDEKKTNKYNYCTYGWTVSGYVKYNEFAELMEKEGLSFSGPETFTDFKDAILNGKKFDIALEADLRTKINPVRLTRKY